MKTKSRIKMWFNSKFVKRKFIKVTDEIYAIRLKNKEYTFVHIPNPRRDEFIFEFSKVLEYMHRLGDNKVTVDEDKLRQNEDWLDKELKSKPKEANEDDDS